MTFDSRSTMTVSKETIESTLPNRQNHPASEAQIPPVSDRVGRVPKSQPQPRGWLFVLLGDGIYADRAPESSPLGRANQSLP